MDLHLLVEIEGGIYIRGRHTRPVGYSKDCEKYNLAVMNGYKVLRFTPDMVKDMMAIEFLQWYFDTKNAPK